MARSALRAEFAQPHLMLYSAAFHANDVNGTITVSVERMDFSLAEAKNNDEALKDEIIRLTDEAGFEAVERDTLYHPLRKYAAA